MIQVNGLYKYYGKKQVLKNINLKISNGMFGLLGKNGAGKTTLMKIMSSLIRPTVGECLIDGVSVNNKKKIRQIIGYMPQEFSLYPDFTCFEMLDYLLLLENCKEKEERKKRIFCILERVNLQDQMHTKIKNLSGGMKRRIGVAQAIMSDPKVVIVDEPTVGLDPEERVHLRNLLSELSEDKIIILSTHIVGDVEDTCGNIAVLQTGNLIYTGTIEKLKEKTRGRVWSVTMKEHAWETEKGRFEDNSCAVQSVRKEGDEFIIRYVCDNQMLEWAKESEVTLEDAYLYMTMKQAGR